MSRETIAKRAIKGVCYASAALGLVLLGAGLANSAFPLPFPFGSGLMGLKYHSFHDGLELGWIMVYTGGSAFAAWIDLDASSSPPGFVDSRDWHGYGIHYAHVTMLEKSPDPGYTYWTLAVSAWYPLILCVITFGLSFAWIKKASRMGQASADPLS